MKGYKHTIEAIQKIKDRFSDPNNHPMFGKTHTPETRKLISKPGELNPMFGKTHSVYTRSLISNILSKSHYLYDKNNNYVLGFKNGPMLAAFLGTDKSQISRYKISGKLFNGQ
jgi:group I intron endonuclease